LADGLPRANVRVFEILERDAVIPNANGQVQRAASGVSPGYLFLNFMCLHFAGVSMLKPWEHPQSLCAGSSFG
jgi:hypothetical protein